MKLIGFLLCSLLATAQVQPQFWRLPPAPVSGSFPTAGLSLALDARTITGLADGASVTGNVWTDMWNTHTSTTTGTAPVYRASKINGRPAVEYVRASLHETQITSAADLQLQMPYAIWYVAQNNSRAANAGQQVFRKATASVSYTVGMTNAGNPNFAIGTGSGNTFTGWNVDTYPHVYGVEVWIDPGSNKTQVAVYRDSATPVEIIRLAGNAQPAITTEVLRIGVGTGSATLAWSGWLGAAYFYKRAANAADGTGVLTQAERQRIVEKLGAEWGIRTMRVDPNAAYVTALGGGPKPITMLAGTNQRTDALPATELQLTGWDKSAGTACCTAQTPALIQPHLVDTVTGLGGYRYILLASSYPNGGGTEVHNAWGSNVVSNNAADWTLLKQDTCGLGLAGNGDADPFLWWDGSTLWNLMMQPIAGGEKMSWQKTTNGTTWTSCVELARSSFTSPVITEWTSPQITTNKDSGAYELWTNYVNSTNSLNSVRKRTAPVGTHFTEANWAAIPYETVVFHSADTDIGDYPAKPGHTTVLREGSLYYMVIFTSGAGTKAKLATSSDGLHFDVARLKAPWGSAQAWCSGGDYRSSLLRTVPGQFLWVGSCGGTGACRLYFATLYGL